MRVEGRGVGPSEELEGRAEQDSHEVEAVEGARGVRDAFRDPESRVDGRDWGHDDDWPACGFGVGGQWLKCVECEAWGLWFMEN